jgi:putative tricarboxylic transport membrane protein
MIRLVSVLAEPYSVQHMRWVFSTTAKTYHLRRVSTRPFIPIVVGLFAISELFLLIKRKAISEDTDIDVSSYKEIIEGGKYVLSKPFQTARAATIGMFIGAMPGSGATLANFLSWATAKSSSKFPDQFGKGNPEGVIASEASNNAVTAGALIPTLALGIPGSGTTAVMLAALLLHGVTPGPELMIEFELEAHVIMISLIFANIILLIFALWVSKYLVRVITLPASLLVPSILVLTVIGTYAVRTQVFDIWLMLIFGVIGAVMRANDYPLVPLLLGVILGPIAEGAFLRSMLVSGGDPMIFFAGPITKILWVLVFVVLFGRPLYDRISDRFFS